MLTTPGGAPASSAITHNANALKGVSSEGLITAVQPAANAGPSFLVIIAAGKFLEKPIVHFVENDEYFMHIKE